MYRVICATCVILSIWLLPANNIANAKRILVITLAPFYSHQIVHRSLSLALNKRGHEIVILTSHPIKDPTLKNYTEIDLSFTIPVANEYRKQFSQMPSNKLMEYAFYVITILSDRILDKPQFKEIYRNDSGEKFDAVIVEAVSGPTLFSMAHRFNAPLIGVISLGLHNYHRYVFGSPLLHSHSSNWELNTLVEENPSIWQRLQNFFEVWNFIYFWNNDFMIKEEETATKYFGNDRPQLVEIMKNMTVLLVNENPAIVHSRPEQPNAVFFSGIHIQKPPPPLSKDLRQFLDNATEGFIYVSFGTTVTCSGLHKDVIEILIEVFSKLSYKVIWKFDCKLPRDLDNTFISKWFPQQGILAHPNIKLFIYQGGLQSTEEAIYYEVPLLGIPIVSEQESRIKKLVSLGAAIHLKFNQITKDTLRTAIYQILGDKSYKKKMTYLKSLSNQPYDGMENAIWWVEFAMRHKGVNHLRFSESDTPWYQRYDIDIIALLAITLFILTCIIILIIFKICKFILNSIIL